MDETTHIIDQAQAQGTFDVLDFISGTAYPTQTVTLFTDAKAATDLLLANEERKTKELEGPTDDLDGLIETLTAKVQASVITFELRGMPPGIVEEIYPADEESDPTVLKGRENKLIAHTIVRVKNHAGVTDARVWDEDAVQKLRTFLKEGEFAKLTTAVAGVNFNAIVFDQATDAGFLSRGSDLAS